MRYLNAPLPLLQYLQAFRRPREAIECYKRALLGTDISSTSISSRLAKLYDEIEDTQLALSYHQTIIDISLVDNKPIHTFAKSLLYVARYHVEMGGGDVKKALTYLEKVAQSNAEEVGPASELLKRMCSIPGVEIEDRAKGIVSLDEEKARKALKEMAAAGRGLGAVPPNEGDTAAAAAPAAAAGSGGSATGSANGEEPNVPPGTAI